MGSGSCCRVLCLVALAATSVNSFLGAPCALLLSPAQLASTSYRHSHFHHGQEIPPRIRLLQANAGDGGEGPAALLRSAVGTRKVLMTEVAEALRVLAEDSVPPAVFGAEEVEGSWELIFSTQLKSGYMPIRELVGFYPSREQASIDANAGPLPLGGFLPPKAAQEVSRCFREWLGTDRRKGLPFTQRQLFGPYQFVR